MYRIQPLIFWLPVFFLCLDNYSAQGQVQQIQEELHKLPFIKDSITRVNSLNRLGMLYRNRNIDSCFHYGMEAKRIATGVHYRKGQIDADHMIAFSLYCKGLYAESLELYSKILSGYQQLADTPKIIRVCMDMAAVLNKDISHPQKVVDFMQMAIHLGRNLKEDSVMALIYTNYCTFNKELTADSIAYYMSRSEEIASRYNDEYMIALNRSKRLFRLNRTGHRPEVLPLAKQLLSNAQRMGNANLQLQALIILSNYYYYADVPNPQEELNYFDQINEVVLQSGNGELQVDVLAGALEAAKRLGNKDTIIKVHIALEAAMKADREKMKKFIGDYVRYNAIENDNRLLNEKNAQRTLWMLIVSFSAIIIVLIIYLIMLYESRKAKAQVETLNNAVNMQIIAMEEAKYQAVREEQQRLGQDLHDGLSSTIAAFRHQLEILSMDIGDTALKNKFDTLRAEMEKAYETVRTKSHEWFSAADEQQEQSFEKQIRLLTNNALPDNRYNKTIQIDDHSLTGVGTDTRIALLRIIQEAVTNIIKHAKARNVEILIYEEGDNLILTINDDGIGLGEKRSGNQRSAMGLESIYRRVQCLKGETRINSNTKGTEVTISIPLAAS